MLFLEHALFGTKHLIIIAICAILIVLGAIFSKKLNLKTMVDILFIVGIISETIKIVYYILTNEATHGGYLPKTDLPFHLCSMQIIFFAILKYSNSEKLKRALLSFMLPSCLFGGIAAILIATNSSRNGGYIITLQYFLYHVAISVFALHILRSKEIKWTIKDYFTCIKLLLFFGLISIYLNSWISYGDLEINFMYTVKAPQPGLPYLNTDHGWGVYMIHYGALAITLMSTLYIKPIISFFKERKNKSE